MCALAIPKESGPSRLLEHAVSASVKDDGAHGRGGAHDGHHRVDRHDKCHGAPLDGADVAPAHVLGVEDAGQDEAQRDNGQRAVERNHCGGESSSIMSSRVLRSLRSEFDLWTRLRFEAAEEFAIRVQSFGLDFTLSHPGMMNLG